MNSTKMFSIRKKNSITEKAIAMDTEMVLATLMATGTDLDHCTGLDMVMEMDVGMETVEVRVTILAYNLDLAYENSTD